MENTFVTTRFVSKEQAEALRNNGFNEPCFGYYMSALDRISGKETVALLAEGVRPMPQEKLPDNLLNAPLYQDVIDWFLEKHSIFITFDTNYDDEKFTTFSYNICNPQKGCLVHTTYCDTYYEARSKAVDEAMNFIPEKK